MKGQKAGLILGLAVALLLSACSSAGSPIRRVGMLKDGAAYDVFVQGDYALVANNDGALIVDFSQRSRPKEVGLIELGELADAVVAQGNLAYVGGGGKGFVIADISDPSNPTTLGQLNVSVVTGLCLEDSIAYASTYQGELKAINVEDPTRPVLVGTYTGRGMGGGVACNGDVVYLALPETGLQVIDISDPTSPVKIATVGDTAGAKDIQIVGERLYLACHANGVRILDISDPRSPKKLAAFARTGEAWGVAGDRSHLWIADLKEGVELYDVSNPASPRLLAQASDYAPHDIFLDGQYVYLADQDKHLVVLEYVAASE